MNDHIGKPFSEVAFYRLLSKWIPTHKHIQRSPRVPSSIDMDNLPSFRGIDTRIGLGLLQGDVMRYRFWLKAFINEAPAAIVRLKAALAANEPDQASMEAHTLKGRMGLLAMKPLHGLASALEKAITHAEPTHTLVADLEQGVASVCAELLAGLGSADTATDDPALCSDIPTGPRPKIIEILLRALQAGDGDCDSRILACIDELAGTPWIPRLLQAQILGNNFDYAAAAKVLTCGQASNGKDT
jgi:HPt (histidine-containing phosphotransfer) domain-containing protein